MDYSPLGASGLAVSPICLGTMMFGDRTDAAEAGRIVGAARDAGINFIDTADVYTKGESERITGRLIGADRARWVLATKVGNRMSEAPNDGGLGRAWMLRALEDSLRRLGTDHVDLWYLHRDDERTPLEETVGAVGDAIRSGKVRYFGLSNYRGWRIAAVAECCRRMGVPPPIACQPYYNAFNRMPEVEVLPASAHYGLGVVPYSPLARGVLTGKYLPGQAPDPATRAGRGDGRMMETEFRMESLVLAQRLRAHAEAKGMSVADFALRWLLNNRLVVSVLAGPRTLDQWTAYLGALRHGFSPEDEALVDSLVAPGHPSTPGYNDPRYPFLGRLPRTG
jgi:aryl-alcohol dehydrogenase-like predicted oxidoreductase